MKLYGQNECDALIIAEARVVSALEVSKVAQLDRSPKGKDYFRIGGPITAATACERLDGFTIVIDRTVYDDRPRPPDEIIIRLDVSGAKPTERTCNGTTFNEPIDWRRAGYYAATIYAIDLCLDPLGLSWWDRGVDLVIADLIEGAE